MSLQIVFSNSEFLITPVRNNKTLLQRIHSKYSYSGIWISLNCVSYSGLLQSPFMAQNFAAIHFNKFSLLFSTALEWEILPCSATPVSTFIVQCLTPIISMSICVVDAPPPTAQLLKSARFNLLFSLPPKVPQLICLNSKSGIFYFKLLYYRNCVR